jgi:hypothetical protein
MRRSDNCAVSIAPPLPTVMAPVPGTTTAAPLTTELEFSVPVTRLLAAIITVTAATTRSLPLSLSLSLDGVFLFGIVL